MTVAAARRNAPLVQNGIRSQMRFTRDERTTVESVASALLSNSGYAEVRAVHCDYDPHRRSLTLYGHVSSYYLKQRAQEAVKIMYDVKCVVNLVTVAAYENEG
jgi:osmotically-inducible protein OsmY